MDPARLAELEEIKQLKARYFRLMDTKQWKEYGDVFTEDCSMANGPADEEPIVGRDAIVLVNDKPREPVKDARGR